MSDPFQGKPLEIDNPQSREEDEELEEQRRRQEELADLLADGIQEFNYDESTMNSSSASVEGAETGSRQISSIKNPLNFKYDDTTKNTSILDTIEATYKDVTTQDQLQVLYDVRVREINSLRLQLNEYQTEKHKEISVLKNKATLAEAELRHVQVSLKNMESLLADKIDAIKTMSHKISYQDSEIDNYKKIIDELKLEICTYSSTVNELQLKLADSNPFSANARNTHAGEIQKAQKDKIEKLETTLQDQSKRIQLLEKQNSQLSEEIKKVIRSKNESDEGNNITIISLSKKLQSSQQQCKDLFVLGEAIKKESDHFKERLIQAQTNPQDILNDSSFKNKSMDKELLMIHVEKLKRMILDKDIEMGTVTAKLKFYNSDMNELFEYRRLLQDINKCEVKPCSNKDHGDLLIFMQRQLQSYQQAVEDRNQQLMNLTLINKELEGKIEEMIKQTRSEIESFTQKYSLPQLETMNKELTRAQSRIQELEHQLSSVDDENLRKKLEQVEEQNKHLRQMACDEKKHSEDMLALTKMHLKCAEGEVEALKKRIVELEQTAFLLREENDKIKSENCLNSSNNGNHSFSERDMKLISKLQKEIQNYLVNINTNDLELEQKLKSWERILTSFLENALHNLNGSLKDANFQEFDYDSKIKDLTNIKTLLEEEKASLEIQIKKFIEEKAQTNEEIIKLKEKTLALESKLELNEKTSEKLKHDLLDNQKYLKLSEENKKLLEEHLDSLQKQINEITQENINLQKEKDEINTKLVRKNLLSELKDADENQTDVSVSERKSLQADLLKAELKLRERLQKETNERVDKIEQQYKSAIEKKIEIYKTEKEKWNNIENSYRQRFSAIVEECGLKITELENENEALIKELQTIDNENKTHKLQTANLIARYPKVVAEFKLEVADNSRKWQNVLEFCLANFSRIETQNQKRIQGVLASMNKYETKIEVIQREYNEKISKLKAKHR